MNIFSLPDDALYEIFEHASSISPEEYTILTHEAPLNVSYTCRAWRRLVLSDSRCWVRILYALRQSDLEVDIRILSLFLERSADALINFKLYEPDIQSPLEEEDLLAGYRIATGKQSRWVEMVLCYPREYRDAVEPAKLHDLSNLTKWIIVDGFPFGLEGHRGSQPPLFIVPIRQTSDNPIAPLLLQLHLFRLCANVEEQRGVLAMLRQCPNLTGLRINFAPEQSDSDDIDEPICIMDKLEELRVDGNLQNIRLFHKIGAPSLRSLKIGRRHAIDTSGSGKELPSLLNEALSSRGK